MMNVLPISVFSRLKLGILNQRQTLQRCPMETDVRGKVAFITGATNGIGKETALGLLNRGIKTILSGRSETKLNQLVQEFTAKGIDPELMETLVIDLADLRSLDQISSKIKFAPIDILIENAGIWPQKYHQTKQGFEIAFGTNVFGHFFLRNELQKSLLSPNAKIIILTGDIYIMESESKTDLMYYGPYGGMKAYCQSKLGNVWVGLELQRRFPNYHVNIVHPGVIATSLGSSGEIGKKIKSLFLLSPEEGAQTSLFCATQTTVSGGYYHNTQGLSHFSTKDPASNMEKAKEYWDKLEALSTKF